ncbi:MAG: hemolysin III family protein [Trueperaceae bacterium]|nr:hemolysin III family protein [Trueperaceae bacterium]
MKPRLFRQLDRYFHEPVNCLTHLFGAVLSLLGTISLIFASKGSVVHIFSFVIYGLSSILLYLASSALHGFKVSKAKRRLLLKFDHVGIFCLIAGSYTPIALIVLRAYDNVLGWGLFALVWVLAGAGMTLKLRWLDLHHWYSTSFYVALGWLALLVLGPLTKALPTAALLLLMLGGLFYTIGAVIFGLQRPNFYPGVFAHHELWHLFVLAGGASHFLMMFWFATPK